MELTTEQLTEHIRGKFAALFPNLQRVMVAFDMFYETWIVNLDNQPEIGDECLSYEFEVGSDDDHMAFRLVAFNCYDEAPTEVRLAYPGDEEPDYRLIGEDEKGEQVIVHKNYWDRTKCANIRTIDAIKIAMSKLDIGDPEELAAQGNLAFILVQAGMKEGDGEVIHFEHDYLTRCIDTWVFG